MKGITSNIMSAIAATNVIIAGMQALWLFHILVSKLSNMDVCNNNCKKNNDATTMKNKKIKIKK